MGKGKIIYPLLVLFGLCTALVYHHVQPSVNYQLNPLADGNEYQKIYDYFRGDSPDYLVRFGIHNRVTVPFLASLLPGENIAQNFFIVNTLFALMSLAALYYLMQSFGISIPYTLLSLVFFSLHYVGPFRQNAIDPINVDMCVYLLEIVFLLLFIKKKYVWLLVLVPPAIAVKEVFLALMVVFFAITVIWKFFFRDKRFSVSWIFAGLVIGIFTKVVLNRYFPSVSPGRNSLLVMAFHVREMLLHPDHVLRWVLGLFAAFGALLFFPVKKLKNIQIINRDDQPVHILSISVLALSFLGGMDYTRLIFLGFPFIIISMIKIGRPETDEFLWALLLTLCLTRFWMVLPDVLGDVTIYNAWMPEYADSTYLIYWTVALLIYLILYFGGLAFWRKVISRGQIAE